MNQPIRPNANSVSDKNLVRTLPSAARNFLIGLALISSGISAIAKAPPDGDQGNGNTAEGTGALSSLTTGANNTADGFQALVANSTGDSNTATGSNALVSNTTASANTADGTLALFRNTIGAANTAVGTQALTNSTVGNENSANGNSALFHNTTGNDNTANGANAGHENVTGSFNTVNGATALYFNTAGSFNVANGAFALNLSTGDNNIAVGYAAGINLTTGGGNIDIGNQGVTGESSTIRIGTVGNQVATFIAGINNATVAGTTVLIDVNGQLGTILSSRRFKEQIKPMDAASEVILALKPVTFRYTNELDPKGIAQFGLVAEEVEKVNPALVVRDAEGKVYSVRYEAINAMLLNEFLKEHHKVQELETNLAQLKSAIARQEKDLRTTAAQQQEEIKLLTANLKAQGSQIQKVSAQIEASKPALQVVGNQ